MYRSFVVGKGPMLCWWSGIWGLFQPQQLCFKVLGVMSGVHSMERSGCAFCSLGRHDAPVRLSLAFCSSVAIPNTVAGPIFMNAGVDKYLGVRWALHFNSVLWAHNMFNYWHQKTLMPLSIWCWATNNYHGQETMAIQKPIYIFWKPKDLYVQWLSICIAKHHVVDIVFDSEWRANASHKDREMMMAFHTMGERTLTALSRIKLGEIIFVLQCVCVCLYVYFSSFKGLPKK